MIEITLFNFKTCIYWRKYKQKRLPSLLKEGADNSHYILLSEVGF